jgi:hypothetical protein
MLVLPQTVNVKWNGMNKKWYLEKGHTFTHIREEFKVNVLDLMPSASQKVEVKCDYCGEVVLKNYDKYSKTHKENEDCCNNCRGKKIYKAKIKYAFEDVKKEFEKRDFILLEDDYINIKTKMSYICNNNHVTNITFNKLLQGQGCKKCGQQVIASKKRKSIDDVRKIFEDNHCMLLTKVYLNNNQKLCYVCECGNIDYKNLSHFSSGQRCEDCRIIKLRVANSKYFLDDIKNIFEKNNCVLLSSEYINALQKLEYICECGNKSEIPFSKFLNGQRCKRCGIEKLKGENNPSWNPYLTEEDRKNRRLIEGYTEWRIQVYERDNYTCQCCGDNSGGNLNAHHLDGYNWCKEKRIDVNNGVTLCKECHKEFHQIYGKGDNTKKQFEEWINKNQFNYKI